MGVNDERVSGKPACAEPRDWQRTGGFLRAMGSYFRFEGWLTKSDLHFSNISWLHMVCGGWISGLKVVAGRPVGSSCKSV